MIGSGLRGRGPDASAALVSARIALRDGRVEDAARGWRESIVSAPDGDAPYANLAAVADDRRGRRYWVERAASAIALGDPAVFRNLGVLAQKRGDAGLAVRRLQWALLLAPDLDRTTTLFAKLQRPDVDNDDGIRWSMRAAVSNPDSVDGWLDLLTRLTAVNRQEDAAAIAETLPVPMERWSDPLLRIVAHAFNNTNRNTIALTVLKRLTASAPTDAKSRTMLAMQHRRAGDHQASVREGRRAAVLEPSSFHCLGALGSELLRAERFDEAVRAFRCCLVIDPQRRPEVVENYGAALVKLYAGDDAEKILREAAIQRPERSVSYINLSTLAFQACELPKADRYGRFSALAGPGIADAHYNLAMIRRHQGRLADARALLDRAVSIDDRIIFGFARAMLELGDGDPADGVRRYDVRWQVPGFSSSRKLGSEPSLPLPVWRGEHRPDATLAIWGEQGIGDELWFAGYLPWAVGRVGRVVLEIAGSLVATMRRSFPGVDVRGRGQPGTDEAIAACDLQVPIGGIMRPFGAGTVPVPTGYLSTDRERVVRLRERYAGDRPGCRIVGLSWRSVKPIRGRSFEVPLEACGPLFALQDTVFVSLQYGDVSADARLVKERFGVDLVVDPEINAYEDIDSWAAQVAAMDSIVSIANSTAAMAHGLAKPIHVLMRMVQDDWRYTRGSETARWLPTARCAWQTSPKDWTGPILTVADRLRRGR